MSRAVLTVGGLALAARLAVVAWAHGRFPPAADGAFYHRIAQRIAEGHGYTWLWPDGAVSYAAHYPVGYPALIALPYWGWPTPSAAMWMNALLGALGCAAVAALVEAHAGRKSALWAGIIAALHPGLVMYTPALMTEGVVAALLACAAWAASASQRTTTGHKTLGLGGALIVGVATLMRPQCLLLAPVFGALAAPRGASRARRLGWAAAALCVAALSCAPWTLRNCERMGRCAFVSVNGGWNLLIGVGTSSGGWAPLEVPAACRDVFDEAAKDRCFGAEARARIVADPWAWLSLVPAKWSTTFDYSGAPGWYLHESNPAAFTARDKTWLGVIETAYERVLLIAALLAAWPTHRRRSRLRLALLGVGLASALWWHATPAWIALAVLLSWRQRVWRRPMFAWAAALIASLLLVHAVFFGAGRYQLVAWPLLCGVAALGIVRRRRLWRALVGTVTVVVRSPAPRR